MNLSILYRGDLSSCNYGCEYCPFAKRTESYADLEADRLALARFVSWCISQPHRLGILFTPWGEALVRTWYQKALLDLSHGSNTQRVAIQTNLSCSLDWINECNRSTVALWCTFHPTETTLDKFLTRCQRLLDSNVRFSVGIVGLKEHFELANELRYALPSEIYFWVNAYKRVPNYYSDPDVEYLRSIDPLFDLNTQHHNSFEKSCRTGASAITVDGAGTIRRCHFIGTPLGNIYESGWERSLKERLCSNQTCGCHIGYVHLDELNLYTVFGDGLLERIPEGYSESLQKKTVHMLPNAGGS